MDHKYNKYNLEILIIDCSLSKKGIKWINPWESFLLVILLASTAPTSFDFRTKMLKVNTLGFGIKDYFVHNFITKTAQF